MIRPVTTPTLLLLLSVGTLYAGPQALDDANVHVRSKIDSLPFLLKDSVNAFNSKLYSSAAAAEAGNFVYSPFSLHMLLSQAYVGAPSGTPTSKELAELLSLNPSDANNEAYLYNYLRVVDFLHQASGKKGLDVNIANRLFAAADLKLKPDFVTALTKFYNSQIVNVDFKNTAETAAAINNFVKDQTNGLIEKLFEEDAIDGLSRLVMVNAVYFKGKWKFPFNAADTETRKFNVDAERQVDYPAMKQTKKLTLVHVEELGADVLELPYESDALAMIVVVPTEGNDVRKVEKSLETFDVAKINDRLEQNVHSEVELVFPKFEAEFSWDNLEDVLKRYGVETLFDPAKSNLTDIADEELHVSKVAHKAVIKVNEEGSEAAAASGAVVATRNEFAVNKAKLVVDRPFIFYIYDLVNRVPLFAGRIVDPGGKLKLQ